MKRWLTWYQTHFPLITTISFVILLSVFIQHIPYVNLFATYFATAALTFVLAICITITGNRQSTNIKFLFGLIGLAYLFEVLTFSYQSEIVGNLFYMLLFYVTLREVWSIRRGENVFQKNI